MSLTYLVAPRRGAWIETQQKNKEVKNNDVAPRRGAWIETGYTRTIQDKDGKSHPAGVRGLKLNECARNDIPGSRTPQGCVD